MICTESIVPVCVVPETEILSVCGGVVSTGIGVVRVVKFTERASFCNVPAESLATNQRVYAVLEVSPPIFTAGVL